MVTGWSGDDGYGDYGQYGDYAQPEDEEPKRSRWFLAVLILLLLILAGLLFLLVRNFADNGDDPTLVTVPNVVGQPADQAQAALEGEGFRVTRATEPSAEEQRDLVVKQDPTANEQAEEGSEITITIGAGPDTATVPDVTGLTVDEASAQLLEAGFVPSQRAEENADVEQNVVIRTDPAAGADAARQLHRDDLLLVGAQHDRDTRRAGPERERRPQHAYRRRVHQHPGATGGVERR